LCPLDAVLPLAGYDFERARILVRSLQYFFEDLGTIWVVATEDVIERFHHQFVGWKFALVPEAKVIPELPLYNFLRRVAGKRRMWGDFVQQLVKLAIADHVQSDWYLCLDADVICLRYTRADDLVRQGRAVGIRYKTEMTQRHRLWYANAARVLSLPASGYMHGVTPALLHRRAVRDLAAHVARGGFGSLGWRWTLMLREPWTEYSLYNTYLEATGQYESYYRPQETGLYDTVWSGHEFDEWDPAALPEGVYFTVVQSNQFVPAIDVWTKVRAIVGG
jgi:Family of unknown function (DUF6492)